MSPLYVGPMWAWTCHKCGRVWHMRAGVLPPPTGCGNAFAGCAGREAPVERVPALDYEAREGDMEDLFEFGAQQSHKDVVHECAAWRAQAEVLMGALEALLAEADCNDEGAAIAATAARITLARLPAATLAERRALEALATGGMTDPNLARARVWLEEGLQAIERLGPKLYGTPDARDLILRATGAALVAAVRAKGEASIHELDPWLSPNANQEQRTMVLSVQAVLRAHAADVPPVP